jgi:hypothetical protein
MSVPAFPVEASRKHHFARGRAIATTASGALLARRQFCLHVGANSDRGDYALLDHDVRPAVAPRDDFAREGLRFPAGEGSASIGGLEPRIGRDVRSQLSCCQPCGDFEIGWDHEDFARLLVLVERAEPRFEPRFPRRGVLFLSEPRLSPVRPLGAVPVGAAPRPSLAPRNSRRRWRRSARARRFCSSSSASRRG